MGGESKDNNAGVAMLANKFLAKGTHFPYAFLMIKEKPLSETEVVSAVKKAKQ